MFSSDMYTNSFFINFVERSNEQLIMKLLNTIPLDQLYLFTVANRDPVRQRL